MLFLFLLFLAAPTVVYLLEDDDTETSVVYSLEEEIQKDIKEIKAGPQFVFEFAFFPVTAKSTVIKSKNPRRHTNVFGDIFLPPPERA